MVLAILPVRAAQDGASAPASDQSAIHVSEFELPTSELLDDEARKALRGWTQRLEHVTARCPYTPAALDALRKCRDENFYRELVTQHRARYSVQIASEDIAGIRTEVVTPAGGVSMRNRSRVLINLHGGGFIVGAGYGGQIESIPIAAVGKFKVISVDYRMAPEHRFPAASEDVVVVYRRLLEDFEPRNIGIYGCSAGALLAAQTLALLQKERLPMPGAVGMFCAGATYWMNGDSSHIGAAIVGIRAGPLAADPYFKDVNPRDPYAFPAHAAHLLQKFPPSLLISGTRDFALSSVVYTHSSLVDTGVDARLFVWEGMNHAFLFDPGLPQSRAAYDVIARFFDRELGVR